MKEAISLFFKRLFIFIMAISIPLMLILYAFQSKKYTDLSKEISNLETQQEKLIEENKNLISDISILTTADRIESVAVDELQMHKAKSDDIVRVEMTGERK
ncbi:MAG: cell division protein FtsL [Treponema sp.]|jgi:cell division protein FtsL|nr:cell division protein FtsL [Treponema sp.]